MSAVRYPDIIAKKRDGLDLTDDDVTAFVKGVASGDMAEAQIGVCVDVCVGM